MARLDPRRSCGKDAGVRRGSGSPEAEKSGGELAYRRRGDSAPLGARRGDALGLRVARGVDRVQGGITGRFKRRGAGDFGVRLGKETRENLGRAPRPLRGRALRGRRV